MSKGRSTEKDYSADIESGFEFGFLTKEQYKLLNDARNMEGCTIKCDKQPSMVGGKQAMTMKFIVEIEKTVGNEGN